MAALWGSEKMRNKRENTGENPQKIQPLVPKQKKRNLLQSIKWLQIENRQNNSS